MAAEGSYRGVTLGSTGFMNRCLQEWKLQVYLSKESTFCTFTYLQRFVVYYASRSFLEHTMRIGSSHVVDANQLYMLSQDLIHRFCPGCDCSNLKKIVNSDGILYAPMMTLVLSEFGVNLEKYCFISAMVKDIVEFKRSLYRIYAKISSLYETQDRIFTSKKFKFLFWAVQSLFKYFIEWRNAVESIRVGTSSTETCLLLENIMEKSRSQLNTKHAFDSLLLLHKLWRKQTGLWKDDSSYTKHAYKAFIYLSNIPTRLTLPLEFNDNGSLQPEEEHLVLHNTCSPISNFAEIWAMIKLIHKLTSSTVSLSSLGTMYSRLGFKSILDLSKPFCRRPTQCSECTNKNAVCELFPLCNSCTDKYFRASHVEFSNSDCVNLIVVVGAIFENRLSDDDTLPTRMQIVASMKDQHPSTCVVCRGCLKCAVLILSICNYRICVRCLLRLSHADITICVRNLYIINFVSENAEFRHYIMNKLGKNITYVYKYVFYASRFLKLV